jgi:hypothetical protein
VGLTISLITSRPWLFVTRQIVYMNRYAAFRAPDSMMIFKTGLSDLWPVRVRDVCVPSRVVVTEGWMRLVCLLTTHMRHARRPERGIIINIKSVKERSRKSLTSAHCICDETEDVKRRQPTQFGKNLLCWKMRVRPHGVGA